MKPEIYYFTGTGNSLAVARDIAEGIDAALIPIAWLSGEASIRTEADVIGVVFPNYYGQLPIIVQLFALKLENISGKYIFAVCTYGGAAVETLRTLRRILRSKGGVLSAAYGIHMPQNAFPKRSEDHRKLYTAWKRKLGLVVENTRLRKRGTWYSNALLEGVILPIHIAFIRPVISRHFRKNSGLPASARMEEHMHALDRNFVVNEQCTGCGICAQVCPVENITISENRPLWCGRCEHCIACYNWCPSKAIEGGITTKGYYYCHPDVELSDIIRGK
jgi:ferredoxin